MDDGDEEGAKSGKAKKGGKAKAKAKPSGRGKKATVEIESEDEPSTPGGQTRTALGEKDGAASEAAGKAVPVPSRTDTAQSSSVKQGGEPEPMQVDEGGAAPVPSRTDTAQSVEQGGEPAPMEVDEGGPAPVPSRTDTAQSSSVNQGGEPEPMQVDTSTAVAPDESLPPKRPRAPTSSGSKTGTPPPTKRPRENVTTSVTPATGPSTSPTTHPARGPASSEMEVDSAPGGPTDGEISALQFDFDADFDMVEDSFQGPSGGMDTQVAQSSQISQFTSRAPTQASAIESADDMFGGKCNVFRECVARN